jgi:hypothetical protein
VRPSPSSRWASDEPPSTPQRAPDGSLLTISAAAVIPAGAQPLRLEDPIRAHERWQREFDRDNDRQARDARDRERDEAILRELQDQAREQRMRDADREMRESIRERERQEERAQDRQERRDERAGGLPGYHERGHGRGCSR